MIRVRLSRCGSVGSDTTRNFVFQDRFMIKDSREIRSDRLQTSENNKFFKRDFNRNVFYFRLAPKGKFSERFFTFAFVSHFASAAAKMIIESNHSQSYLYPLFNLHHSDSLKLVKAEPQQIAEHHESGTASSVNQQGKRII